MDTSTKKRQPTDILCYSCQKANFEIVEPFGEVQRAALCPECGEYYYKIGSIVCVYRVLPIEGTTIIQLNELLGSQSLLPWAKDYLKEFNHKIGLPSD